MHKLHSKYNECYKQVSLTVVSKLKLFLCQLPFQVRKRSRAACVYPVLINTSCLEQLKCIINPKNLILFQSLTGYIYNLKTSIVLPKVNNEKLCKFYVFIRVAKSHIGKDGQQIKYAQIVWVDDHKPAKYLLQTILRGSNKDLKHRLA